jgi:hypothetical protein
VRRFAKSLLASSARTSAPWRACFEQVRVGVEGHAGAGVAEDAADLDDVEADVDDQVAGEGVAQIVEAHPPAVAIETGVGGSAAQNTPRDVVVEKRRAP